MSDDKWFILIVFGWLAIIFMMRLDRLEKQIDAAARMIRSDVARDPQERDDIWREWNEYRRQAAKEVRQYWISLWSIVGFGVLGWFVITYYR